MLYSELFQIAENLNSVSYFIEQGIEKESNLLKILDLRTKTENLSKIIKRNEDKIKAIESLLTPITSFKDAEYLAGSKLSAVSKGHEVLRQVNALNFDYSKYGLISLGGGDGTELYTEIDNSNINFGLLLEYDYDSVNKFSKNYIPFKLQNYKRWDKIDLDVIECDLFDKNKLATAKKIIQSKNLGGIIVSIHAVLHELSTRSQLKSQFLKDNGEIQLESFFREIYEWHKNILLIIREPGIAENWPTEVYLTIADKYRTKFLKILREIDDAHFKGTQGNNFDYLKNQNIIRCKSNLAIEALTKLFYYQDYQYEKREKVTSISREDIVKALQVDGKLYKILKTETFFTGSVQSNMSNFGVVVTKTGGIHLPIPQCFTYTIASKGHHSIKTSKI